MAGQYHIGDTVLGNWTLVKPLGQGSFGRVYEAHRVEYGITYKSAIKIIAIPYSRSEIISARAEGMDDASIRAYFEDMVTQIVREFALMSLLKGTAHVVSYEDHAVIPHEDDIGWDILIRMELLTPLLEHMSRHILTLGDILQIGIDICRALELCQRHNIIHRDIKPENMFLAESGDYKIGDFGIARIAEKTTGGMSKKGTYAYMAPEVYREDAYGPGVDIYSLGIVLYRLLNDNRAPFLPLPPQNISHADRELALIRRMSGEALPKPVNADNRLATVILKACAYDPRARYSSPSQFREALEQIAQAAPAVRIAPVADVRETPARTTRGRSRKDPARSGAASGEQDTNRTVLVHTRGTHTRTDSGSRTGGRQDGHAAAPRVIRSESIPSVRKPWARIAVATAAIAIAVVCGTFLFVPRLLSSAGARASTGDSAAAASMPSALPPETTSAGQGEEEFAEVEELITVVTEDTISLLEAYSNLRVLDLSGSTCYEAIMRYEEAHPEVDVRYTVTFGDTVVDRNVSDLSLEPSDADYETLLSDLKYLPKLTTLTLPDIALTAEQVRALRQAYPELTLDYAVEIAGYLYGCDTTQIDWRENINAQIFTMMQSSVERLGLLTELKDVYLSESLSLANVAVLQDANPGAVFHYDFTLFGQPLSTTDTEVEYKGISIGNAGETQLRQALSILDNCQRFVLDDCDIDYDVLAAIRDDFRDGPKVVWRVYFGTENRYNTLTDTDTIRALHNVTDSTCGPLKYCEDVKYMEIGYNEYLTDLSFVGYMPNIEVLIASGCAARELVGFDICKELTWLELAYCDMLQNIDSLSGCESLAYLNLSYSGVTNFSALYNLPLERFVCLQPQAPTDEQKAFVANHPASECITVFSGYTNPYGYGWRYDDNGKTFNEYYKNVIRKAFNYDYLESLLPDE